MKTQIKPWRWLETFPTQAAVLAEWEKVCGAEFERARSFLIPTKRQSLSYPCTHRFPCDCEHRVVMHSPKQIVACCQCEAGDCSPIRLQARDLMIYELDSRKLGEAIRRTFKFEPGQQRTFYSALRVIEIGAYGHLHSPVFFHIVSDEGLLLEQLEGLFLAKADPFLLVMPTRVHFSAQIESMLKARRCGFIPMSVTLALGAKGKLTQSNSIDSILTEFERRDTVAADDQIVSVGRLRYRAGFEDIWLNDLHYNLRERDKARLCIKYLMENKAFDAASARHLVTEIDEFVRAKGNFPRAAEIKIDHYFNDHKGKLPKLRKDLIQAAGRNGRFFLKVH